MGGLPDHRPVFDVVPGFSVDPIRRPAPPNRRFSPEARNGLAARYNAGEDTAELAAEYGVSVQENAKPSFPVEYLLVTLTHGFPSNPIPLLQAKAPGFPVENRQVIGESQEFKDIGTCIGLKGNGQVINQEDGILAVSDFHLLCFLHSIGILSKVSGYLIF